MRKLRTEEPNPEEFWGKGDIIAYLGCDETKALEIMEGCRSKYPNKCKGYGDIEKHILLDFINEKQREEREREARHNADIATVRQVTALEEQVKILREMCDSSSKDARKAQIQSLIANFISVISMAVAIIALVLKLN